MLGVNKDTSEEDIKKAIIKLVNNTNPDNKNSILLKIEEYFATPKDKRDLKYFDLFKFIGFGFNTETKGWLEGNNCDIIKN